MLFFPVEIELIDSSLCLSPFSKILSKPLSSEVSVFFVGTILAFSLFFRTQLSCCLSRRKSLKFSGDRLFIFSSISERTFSSTILFFFKSIFARNKSRKKGVLLGYFFTIVRVFFVKIFLHLKNTIPITIKITPNESRNNKKTKSHTFLRRGEKSNFFHCMKN